MPKKPKQESKQEVAIPLNVLNEDWKLSEALTTQFEWLGNDDDFTREFLSFLLQEENRWFVDLMLKAAPSMPKKYDKFCSNQTVAFGFSAFCAVSVLYFYWINAKAAGLPYQIGGVVANLVINLLFGMECSDFLKNPGDRMNFRMGLGLGLVATAANVLFAWSLSDKSFWVTGLTGIGIFPLSVAGIGMVVKGLRHKRNFAQERLWLTRFEDLLGRAELSDIKAVLADTHRSLYTRFTGGVAGSVLGIGSGISNAGLLWSAYKGALDLLGWLIGKPGAIVTSVVGNAPILAISVLISGFSTGQNAVYRIADAWNFLHGDKGKGGATITQHQARCIVYGAIPLLAISTLGFFFSSATAEKSAEDIPEFQPFLNKVIQFCVRYFTAFFNGNMATAAFLGFLAYLAEVYESHPVQRIRNLMAFLKTYIATAEGQAVLSELSDRYFQGEGVLGQQEQPSRQVARQMGGWRTFRVSNWSFLGGKNSKNANVRGVDPVALLEAGGQVEWRQQRA